LDPVKRTLGKISYAVESVTSQKTLTLPMGTNTSPDALRSIIQIPPSGEILSSPLGLNRLYNKADLIIIVSNSTAIAKSGAYNNFSVVIPWSSVADQNKKNGKIKKTQGSSIDTTFISTNLAFFDKRENRIFTVTEIDLAQFLAQSSFLTASLGRSVKILYVADMREDLSSSFAVRLVNGETLPANGLSIITPNPLYVSGNFNTVYQGASPVPAALMSDAITLLSESWNDAYSTYPLIFRSASATTVNAAILTGNVPSDGDYYSGGVENLVRLLENWYRIKCTINGSLVCLYPSRYAISPWGATPDVYSTPNRDFKFNENFADPGKLPPGTPELRTVLRSKWENLASAKRL
jgi:hypothetical protein